MQGMARMLHWLVSPHNGVSGTCLPLGLDITATAAMLHAKLTARGHPYQHVQPLRNLAKHDLVPAQLKRGVRPLGHYHLHAGIACAWNGLAARL